MAPVRRVSAEVDCGRIRSSAKMEFTKLEKDILAWYMAHAECDELRQQVQSAQCAGREYTGVGFFVGLSVPDGAPPLGNDWDSVPIAGPLIEGPELECGGDTVLFTNEKGIIDCLEIFAYGDRFPQHLREYRLTEGQNNGFGPNR
jgi:hypothetical protein